MRKLAISISVMVLAIMVIAMGVGCAPPSDKQITVGNKNFTEQYVVGELMKQLLEDRGFAVELVADLSTMALRGGMEAGDLDICADYTGTAWMVHLEHEYEPGVDNNELYRLVKEEEEGKGFIYLNPIWNNNTYALASWPEFVEEHNVEALSDLAALYREEEGKITMFVTVEFSTRPDGLPAMQEHYDFEVDEGHIMTGAAGMSLIGLEQRECDVGMVFGTDAKIAEHGWHVYMDDKSFFPPYDLAPYVREEVLAKYPEIADILNELVGTFPGGGDPATPETVAECQKSWQGLNAKVDIDKMEPDEVAHEYLVKHGLIKE